MMVRGAVDNLVDELVPVEGAFHGDSPGMEGVSIGPIVVR
jgi:hypothetical protein